MKIRSAAAELLVVGMILAVAASAVADPKVIDTIHVSRPGGVGVNPVTNRIYVTNYYLSTVSVIDGATDTVFEM